MKSLIKFSLSQGVMFNVVFAGLIIFSVMLALPNLSVEQFPNFTFGEVQIMTSFPGASADEVERLVTQEIEESLRDMKNLDYVKSTSRPDLSVISIKFIDDTDYEGLYDELRFRVMGIQNRLPVQNGDPLNPVFTVPDVDEWLPVVQVNLVAEEGHSLSKRTLVLLAKDLRQRLEQLDQVKKVTIVGDAAEQFVVSLDPAKLEMHRLTIDEVTAAMRSSGRAPPAGSITTGSGERLIRIDKRYRSKQDILEVPVRKDGHGNVIHVEDLIDHKASGLENLPGGIISSVNGLDIAGCKVMKKAGGNALDINKDVRAEVARFIEDNKTHRVRAVYTLDGTNKIKDGLGVLTSSLLLSAVFVMGLLFLFLSNRGKKTTFVGLVLAVGAAIIVPTAESTMVQSIALLTLTLFVMITCREALLTVSGIIFSFLGSLLVFYLTGQSINELTLLGFVIVCGIVVDDAVVVIENIKRHRERGKAVTDAVIDGTAEVFWPVVSASLTTMAAFLPLLLMTGATGDFFSLVPIAVTVALFISLIECLLFLPLHVVDLEKILGSKETDNVEHKEEGIEDHLAKTGIMGLLSRVYNSCLNWTLRHPIVTVSSAVLLFALAVFILMMPAFGFKPILKLVFFPDDTSIVQVTVDMPDGTPQQKTDETVRAISRYLIAKGEKKISNTSAQAGMIVTSDYKPVFASQYGFIQAQLPLKEERDFDNPGKFIIDLRKELEEKFEKDGINLIVEAAKDGPPQGSFINMRVSGLDDRQIMRSVEGLMAYVNEQSAPGKALHGVIDMKHDRQLHDTVVSFDTDLRKLANYDLREDRVQQFVADSLDGAYIADFRRLDDEIPLKLRLSRDAIKDPVDLLNVPVVNQQDGKRVLFSDVGSVKVSTEPSSLIRWNFQRIITITAGASGETKIDPFTANAHIQSWWKENKGEYPGVVLSFGGESESTGKSYRSLMFSFLLAVILIYGILASQFQSYIQPLLIMSNVFFSFTGVILTMALLGLGSEMLPEGTIRPERSFFTVNGFMAVIGLTGLVINDAIVLITFMNKRVAEGLPLRQALLLAGHQRMRPILMTTLTTIAGLLPMAIGIPDFSIAWSPFATAFIAGLSVSTLMTLLVLPVLYEVIEKMRGLVRFRRSRKSAVPVESMPIDLEEVSAHE